MVKDRGVSVKLSTNFFNNIFEPKRKEFENKLGVKFGQIDFTELLDKRKAKFSFPLPNTSILQPPRKIKIKKVKKRRK